MIEIDLKTFIETGIFGPVCNGMTKDAVKNLIGEPRLDSDDVLYGSILLYSWYELFFDEEDILYIIQNHSSDLESFEFKNDKIKIDTQFINNVLNKTIEEVSNLLKLEDIKFQIIDFYGRIAIEAESGVILDFENEDGNNRFIGLEIRK